MAAASVGVKKPVKIPPRMMIGVRRLRKALLAAISFSMNVVFRTTGKLPDVVETEYHGSKDKPHDKPGDDTGGKQTPDRG